MTNTISRSLRSPRKIEIQTISYQSFTMIHWLLAGSNITRSNTQVSKQKKESAILKHDLPRYVPLSSYSYHLFIRMVKNSRIGWRPFRSPRCRCLAGLAAFCWPETSLYSPTLRHLHRYHRRNPNSVRRPSYLPYHRHRF